MSFSPDLLSAPADKIFYALTMFPYPSGVGLHAGHASVFTINDIVARYKTMKGYTVLNPFGFDAFGLPTENYALQENKGAREVTDTNKAMFLEQVKALNISFDYERVIDTSMPDYYKWTQWIFTKLMEAGLVYRDEKFVNRCPSCQTVLANDQVVDGKCERCKSEVFQKKHMQWFIKITDYADRLISDLDLVDRPEETKTTQKNWIGRSEGMLFSAKVKDIDLTIQTFSAHFEACYADTFVVIAPEHDLVKELIKGQTNEKEVLDFCEYIMDQRKEAGHEGYKAIEGIFTGRYIEDPLGNGDLPIWVASFAVADYGTGIVKCSAHDERDFEFAKKYNIPLKTVLLPYDEELKEKVIKQEICFSDMGNGYLTEPQEFERKQGKDIRKEMIAYLENKGYAQKKVSYKLRDRSVSRQRYRGSPIPVYYDENKVPHAIPESELPVILPLDVKDFKPKGKSPLEDHPTFKHYEKDGKTYLRECDTLDTFMCSSFYFLRFPDAHNDEALIRKELADKCLPVDFYSGGKEHTVGHLLYSRFIHKFLYDQGYVPSAEPFKKLVHQGMVLGADGRKMGKRYNNGVDPLEIVQKYGSDAVRTYLMFMGPIEADKIWNDNALSGIKKFLDRVEKLPSIERYNTSNNEVIATIHDTIIKITEDIESYKFNTAVSKLMIAVNTIYDHKAIDAEHLGMLAQLLAPFAPILAQQLWEQTGKKGEIAFSSRPQADTSKITMKPINFPIQINGKMRGTLMVPAGISEQDLLALVHADESLSKHLTGTTKKVIFVADKIMNIINN